MEYVSGKSLGEYLAAKKLSLAQIVEVIRQVADAIDFAHSAGILHRDLKPDNIMLGKNLAVKVMDFGLAKIQSEDDQLSQTGLVLGTLPYMSPEQVSGKIRRLDARSDVYSLGVILYEAVTKSLPFSGNSFVELAKKFKKIDQFLPEKFALKFLQTWKLLFSKLLRKSQ